MIYEVFLQPFSEFSFMRRALMGSIAIGLGAIPVGVFMMLRRMSLTGDAMAHAILPGAAIAYLLTGLSITAMTVGGLLAGLSVAICAGLVARHTQLKEDTSMAAFYLVSLASGVLILSLKGSNVDLFHVLFGSILALDNAALFLLAGIGSFSIVLLTLIFRPLVLECVDPLYLRSVSRTSPLAHYGFLVLMVTNLVAGFHALGTLMAVGLMILPPAAARFWTETLGGMIVLAVCLGLLGSYCGLLLSYHRDLPAGPAIILVHGLIYLLSMFVGKVNGVLSRRFAQQHLTG